MVRVLVAFFVLVVGMGSAWGSGEVASKEALEAFSQTVGYRDDARTLFQRLLKDETAKGIAKRGALGELFLFIQINLREDLEAEGLDKEAVDFHVMLAEDSIQLWAVEFEDRIVTAAPRVANLLAGIPKEDGTRSLKAKNVVQKLSRRMLNKAEREDYLLDILMNRE